MRLLSILNELQTQHLLRLRLILIVSNYMISLKIISSNNELFHLIYIVMIYGLKNIGILVKDIQIWIIMFEYLYT